MGASVAVPSPDGRDGRASIAAMPDAPTRETLELADRLHSAAIHLLRRLRRSDPLTGVNPAQLSALSVLMGGPRTVGELAAAEQVRVPTMSRLVREMEAAGLVSRERDGLDGRVVWVEWTAKGERVLQQGRGLRIAALAERLQALSAAERQSLLSAVAVLDRLSSPEQVS
jgi:DNA-binding MarR family transcriptional regulator